jgi:hypothetical protein
VVLLQPTLVKLQRLPGAQGAKDGYITPKACLSSSLGRGFFLTVKSPGSDAAGTLEKAYKTVR